MVHLDKKLIHYLSELCRIHCSEEEEDSLLQDLEKILSYIEQLDKVPTEQLLPCNHVLKDMANVMREDVVGETMPRQVLLDNAPDSIAGLIRFPSVIKSKQ